MEIQERLERLRRRAELERRLVCTQPGGLPRVGPGGGRPEPEPVERGEPVEPVGVPYVIEPGPGTPPVLDAEPAAPYPNDAEPAAPYTVGLQTPLGQALPEPDTAELRAVGATPAEEFLLPDPQPPHDGPAPEGSADEGGTSEGGTVEGRPRGEDVDGIDPAAAPAPEPWGPMIYDVLAALRPVLQRYPGLVAGIWPPGAPLDEVRAAARVALDPVNGLTLQMPDPTRPAPSGDGEVGDGEVGDGGRRSVAEELASLLRGGRSER